MNADFPQVSSKIIFFYSAEKEPFITLTQILTDIKYMNAFQPKC
jgi:hypothetical protein